MLTVAATLVSVGARPAAAAVGPSGTSPLGAAPTLPAHATVQNEVSATRTLDLTVGLQSRDAGALTTLAEQVSTPGSPSYRRYLSPGEFAQRFGATDASVKTVEEALTRLGLPQASLSANHLALSVTTTAGQASKAFGVHLHNVRLASGRTAFANDVAPQLPVTVVANVAGILGLDNLALARPLWQSSAATQAAAPATTALAAPATTALAAPATTAIAAPASTALAAPATPHALAAAGPQPCAAASNAGIVYGGYTADQLAKAYSFGGLYAKNTLGAGVTIAIYELASYQPSDITSFQACYGTTAAVTNRAVDGGPNPTDPGAIEVELDIEGVISMAPKANIAVYLGPNGSPGVYDIYNRIVSDDTSSVVTTSWGQCEALQGAQEISMESTLFQQAAIQGQTILAATGDNGSEDCQPANGSTALAVDDPGSQPFVTAVGGTNLTALGPAPTETVWNESAQQIGAGGGGISAVWRLPPAQHGPGVDNSFSSRIPCAAPVGSLCRETPDVTASADPVNGYVVYYTGSETGQTGWQAIGGTSAGAPLWAALIALANQNCGCSLGYVNAAMYNIAAAGGGSFNDITSGNNDYLGLHGGAYPATAGYDMGSGLGSPIATTLAAALNPQQAPAFTADTPPSAGAVNTAYSSTFAATGNPAPTFSVATGAVPTGLSLNATTGVLAGTPTTPGPYTFTVSAGNGVGTAAVSPSITITISAATTLPGYQAVVPVRICDTRASGPGVVANQCDTGGHSPLSTSGVLNVTVAGVAGVPANASAVVLHVTATGTSATSYLTVWPTGQSQPTAATLNWIPGQNAPNLVESGVGTNGQVSVFNYAGSVDVVVDLQGYVVPASGAVFVPLTPVRVCDTRLGQVANQCNNGGTAAGTLASGHTRVVNVETGFGVPAGATAVVLNVTATTTSAASYFTVWPDGATQPLAASLNWAAGQTISNRVITPVSPAGNIDVFNANGSADVVIDLGGYYSLTGTGSGFFPVVPTRICDTRAAGPGVASNSCDASGPGTLAGGHGLTLGGFDASIAAVVVNVTVTNTGAAGFLTVYPNSGAFPLAADLTWSAHQTIGNLTVAGLGTTATMAIFNGSSASTDVVVDLVGYYDPTGPVAHPGPTVAAARPLSRASRS